MRNYDEADEEQAKKRRISIDENSTRYRDESDEEQTNEADEEQTNEADEEQTNEADEERAKNEHPSMSDGELTEELRELEATTEGRVATGIITDISSAGDEIVVTVEFPHDSFTERFQKPRPPTNHYKFTRVAESYSQGLVDIEELDGETVGCVYDEHSDEWSIIDPKTDTGLPFWMATFPGMLLFLFTAPLFVAHEQFVKFKYGQVTALEALLITLTVAVAWGIVYALFHYTLTYIASLLLL